MEFEKRRRPAMSPLTPPQGNTSPTSSFISKFTSTVPKRMTKRSKLPPPLQLDPLTPPPTVIKPHMNTVSINRQFSSPLVNQVSLADDPFGMDLSITSSLMSINTPTSFQLPKSKSYLKEICCMCEEPITTKLTNERTLELDCEHKCHHNCYLVLLNKNDMSDLPVCSMCGTQTQPVDESILEDLFSQTLVQEELEDDKSFDTGHILNFDDSQTPIAELLPPITTSAFRPNLFDTSTPYTPQYQMTNNLNSSGFEPSSKQPALTAVSSARSSVFNRRTSERSNASTPRCSVDDLIKPQVSILSEFPKHSIIDNLKTYRMSHMLNIYTNEVLTPRSDSEHTDNELKFSIHDKVLSHLSSTIKDSKGVDFSQLPTLRMFDYFDISLDGSAWEYVYAFIFDDVLLLVNEEMDSVVGTVLIGEHYTSCYRVDEETMVSYFSSSSLPELQIHSSNKILIAKWVDFFEFKLRQKKSITLVQMTTNSWDLVDDGSLTLPKDVVKFNDLTAKGLDLPIQVMRSVMTTPRRLPCVVVACIPLYNDSELGNEIYLRQIKNSLRLILDELETGDRFGLVLMGRSGKRVFEESETTYLGITSADWPQWDDIIDDLQVYSGSKKSSGAKMNAIIGTVGRLSTFWPELEQRDAVKKLIMLRCGAEDDEEAYDFKPVLEKGFSVHDILIATKYDSFTNRFVSSMAEVEGMRQYHLQRYDDFSSFHNSIPSMTQKFKRVLISTLDVSMDIELSSYVSFVPVETSEKFSASQDQKHWDLKLKDLEDGHYTNTRFDVQLDIEGLITNYGLTKNKCHEIPVLKYSYTYDGKISERTFSVKLCVNELQISSMLSPMDAPKGQAQEGFMDIPLLPPLSSWKDSLFVKKQVELLVIETLTGSGSSGASSIHELVTWIFGLIRGCSTTHVEFFKNSRFNKYRNFSCYIDELIKRLNKTKVDDVMKRDLVNALTLEEGLEWF